MSMSHDIERFLDPEITDDSPTYHVYINDVLQVETKQRSSMVKWVDFFRQYSDNVRFDCVAPEAKRPYRKFMMDGSIKTEPDITRHFMVKPLPDDTVNGLVKALIRIGESLKKEEAAR